MNLVNDLSINNASSEKKTTSTPNSNEIIENLKKFVEINKKKKKIEILEKKKIIRIKI